MTLLETVEFLRDCHRQQPFLLFNGNVFAELGRRLIQALFADLPPKRRAEAASVVAHAIAGVLDINSMKSIVDGLVTRSDFNVGDPVRTLRGSLRGVVTEIDGEIVVFRCKSTGALIRSSGDSLVVDR